MCRDHFVCDLKFDLLTVLFFAVVRNVRTVDSVRSGKQDTCETKCENVSLRLSGLRDITRELWRTRAHIKTIHKII